MTIMDAMNSVTRIFDEAAPVNLITQQQEKAMEFAGRPVERNAVEEAVADLMDAANRLASLMDVIRIDLGDWVHGICRSRRIHIYTARDMQQVPGDTETFIPYSTLDSTYSGKMRKTILDAQGKSVDFFYLVEQTPNHE